jgi:hypothetical protein
MVAIGTTMMIMRSIRDASQNGRKRWKKGVPELYMRSASSDMGYSGSKPRGNSATRWNMPPPEWVCFKASTSGQASEGCKSFRETSAA